MKKIIKLNFEWINCNSSWNGKNSMINKELKNYCKTYKKNFWRKIFIIERNSKKNQFSPSLSLSFVRKREGLIPRNRHGIIVHVVPICKMQFTCYVMQHRFYPLRQTLTYNPYKYGRDFAESINGGTRAKQFVHRVTYIIHPDNYVRCAKISRHANTRIAGATVALISLKS